MSLLFELMGQKSVFHLTEGLETIMRQGKQRASLYFKILFLLDQKYTKTI